MSTQDDKLISLMMNRQSGAMKGDSAIMKDWMDTCERANEWFFEELDKDKKANFRCMVQRLAKVLKTEKQGALDWTDILERLPGKVDYRILRGLAFPGIFL